jgi:hypothetical protein
MLDTTKCNKTKDGAILTPKGRLSYAGENLFVAHNVEGETDPEKRRYSTSIVLKGDVDLKLLVDLVNDTAKAKWGDDCFTKFKIKKPFLKVEDFPKMAALYEDGFKTMLRLASKSRPQVVLADGRTPASVEDAFSGRWAIISVNAFTYDHRTGGKGVSLGLQNVQLLELDERLGGNRAKAEDQFADFSSGADASKGESADDIYN